MSWHQEFNFSPISSDFFYRSPKKGDHRFGDIVKPMLNSWTTLPKNSGALSDSAPFFALAGYPDDEGIALNHGRVGAAQGPDAIRKSLYRCTPGLYFNSLSTLLDVGNLNLDTPLEQRHLNVENAAFNGLQSGYSWVGLGGGHDYAYPDGAAFLKANQKSSLKPLILNFDAHLDVREPDQGLSSGTPFYRLLTDSNLPQFDLYEIGIQGQCNSQTHWDWAFERCNEIITFEEINASGLNQTAFLSQRFKDLFLKKRPTFVSIDIDGFAACHAMGCSQAWPTGFVPNEFLPFLNILFSKLDVQVLGIYEVSPPLDQDSRTVKLASQIIHQFIGNIR